jgi:hypothetical protein
VSEVYETDFVLWSAQQAERLRRLARGEQVNDVDWPNLVEEVETLGRSATSAVRSLLLRALEHILKAAAWPGAVSARKWLHDANVFLGDAQLDWAPSMAIHIDMDRLYARAVANVTDLEFEEGAPAALRERCPVSIEDLLHGKAEQLVARFGPLRPRCT